MFSQNLVEVMGSFPDRIAEFMDRELRLGRRFREETITDMLMFQLSAFEGRGVRVRYPKNEKITGADMLWHFVRRGASPQYFSKLIQAKRAKPTGKKGEWFYAKLDYPSNGTRSQAETLVSRAAGGG